VAPDAQPGETVIVDDGSGAPVAVERELADELRVTVIRIAPGGPAVARNAGWRAAGRDWVLFVDSD
jgi:glycosyltransferase involved in cell wall biosynthesis